MTKIIAAVLAIAFGTAQAMPIMPHSAEKSASAAAAQQASALSRPDTARMDTEEDEAAPPVHIHHARSVSKKTPKKLQTKKIETPAHAKRYSLLLPN